jgi:DNA-directed RNA polymerase specialized sigma24 family protein
MFDLMVCEIEKWDKKEYINEIKKMLNSIDTSNKKKATATTINNDALMESLIRENMSKIRRQCQITAFMFHTEPKVILSDVLERMWRRRKTYVHESNKVFLNWVSLISKHTAIDLYRREKKVEIVEISEFNVPMSRHDKQNYSEKDYVENVKMIMKSQLEDIQFRVMMMVGDGRKYKDIGKEVGLPESKVKMMVYRTRQELKEIFRNFTI